MTKVNKNWVFGIITGGVICDAIKQNKSEVKFTFHFSDGLYLSFEKLLLTTTHPIESLLLVFKRVEN